MDAEKLGAFIGEIRKEKGMTQKELAMKLNVTDKAVSKWERGLGLPDINTIEPLADALGVSIAELMKSERIEREEVKAKEAEEIVAGAFDLAKYQKRLEFRRKIVAIILAMAGMATLLAGVYNRMKYTEKLEEARRILNNADGADATFVAVKLVDFSMGFIAVGAILLVVSVVVLLKKRK